MVVIYDNKKYLSFYYALKTGDYIICRVKTIVESIKKSGFEEPVCLVQEV